MVTLVSRSGKTYLVFEIIMREQHAFLHLDDNIRVTILGRDATVTVHTGMMILVRLPRKDIPLISSITISLSNDNGKLSETYLLKDILIKDLLTVDCIEFQYKIIPFCKLAND